MSLIGSYARMLVYLKADILIYTVFIGIFIGEMVVVDDYRWKLGPEIKEECSVKPVTF